MEKIKKTRFLFAFIITAIFLFMTVVFYFFYTKSLLTDKSEDLALKYQSAMTEIIKRDMENKYNSVFTHKELDGWTTLDKSSPLIQETLKDEKYLILEKRELLTNDHSTTPMIVIQDNDHVAYSDVHEYFKTLLEDPNHTYILSNRQGKMIYKPDTMTQTNLSMLFTRADIKWLDNNLTNPNKVITNISVLNQDSFFSMQELISDILFVQIVDVTYYQLNINSLRYQFLFFSLTILAISSIYMVVLYRGYTRKEIENKIYKSSIEEQGTIVLTVDKTGEILKKQEKFEKVLEGVQNIFELKDQSLEKQKINKRTEFSALVGNESYQFFVIPYKNKYVLIGKTTSNETYDEQKYKDLAYLDMYTKIPNLLALRHYMSSVSATTITASALIDIKDFRKIKKIYGSEVSRDIVLHILTSIESVFNENKIKLFNIKTDTFMILFEDDKIESVLIQKQIAKLQDIYQYPLVVGNTLISLSIKAALMISDDHIRTLELEKAYELLNLTLNKAKKSNIYDLVVYDDELSHFLTREEMMRKDLEKAIDKDEFIMYLQPQYSLKKDKIEAYEALLRWSHEKYINTSPSTYIQMAEEDMLIHDIGKVVFDKTLQIMTVNKDLRVAINVSPKQFLQPGFIETLEEKTIKYGVDPKNVALEVTETVLMESFDIVINKLKVLKEIGFKIHLDDFGTGYSSLKYVKDLPIDSIKIDKQFIQNIEKDAKAKVIVETFIDLGHKLNLTVIAEGVETEIQAQVLENMGCDYIQGYLVGRPEHHEKALKNKFKRNKKKEGK